MSWHCISPPHSEDVIWAAQTLVRHAITNPSAVKSRLEAYGWEIESVNAVLHEIQRIKSAARVR